MNKISVIIPTWNRANVLKDAVESALIQTYPPFEILICDDGSTDSSEEIIKGMNDSRIKWIPGSRGGRPAIPRNRGIEASQGEWLAFLDSDDQWHPEKLEVQFDTLNQTGCRASCTNAFRVQAGAQCAERLIEWKKELLTFNDLVDVNRVVCSSVLVSKDIVQKVGGFPEDIKLTACEDYALWLKVCTETNFAYCQEPLVDYTDVPDKSVRTFYTDGESVKKAVCSDFIEWSTGNNTLISIDELSKSTRVQLAPSHKKIIEYIRKVRKKIFKNNNEILEKNK